MKKIGIALLLVLCCLTVGCSKKENTQIGNGDIVGNVEKLVPADAEPSKEALSENELTGAFANDLYAVTVETENDEMVFTVVTKEITEHTGYEWVIRGYFSEENSRVNYTDAVKTKITFDKNGSEKQRQTEYDYGSGRMQFTDPDHLVWNNNTEFLAGSRELTRQK